MSDLQVAEAAGILFERRRAGATGPRLPVGCRPTDVVDALRIQRRVLALAEQGLPAWKCGLPEADKLILAPIHGRTVHRGSPCPAHAVGGQIKVEPELAFVLGHDLPARSEPYADAEVDAAIARTHLALELIEQRFDVPAELTFAEKLADGLVNQGLLLGPVVDAQLAAATQAIDIEVGDGELMLSRHEGRHPAGLPRRPLYWLVDYLRTHSDGLRAGQAVITGSYAGSWFVPIDRDLRIRFGDLGEMPVRFLDSTRLET